MHWLPMMAEDNGLEAEGEDKDGEEGVKVAAVDGKHDLDRSVEILLQQFEQMLFLESSSTLAPT